MQTTLVKPRILAFDDKSMALQGLKDLFEIEEIELCAVKIADINSIQALAQRLEKEWWHAVIADVMLLSDDRDGDKWGLKLVVDSDPIVPKILWTAYSSDHRLMKDALKVIEGTRTAPAINVVEKGDNDELLSTLDSLFKRNPKYRLNFNLKIQDQTGILYRIARHNATKSDSITALQAELCDLLRKQFFEAQTIKLSDVPFQPPDGALVKVDVNSGNARYYQTIIHIGLRGLIKQIEERTRSIEVCGDLLTIYSGCCETLHFAAFHYGPLPTLKSYKTLAEMPLSTKQFSKVRTLLSRVLPPLHGNLDISSPEHKYVETYYIEQFGLKTYKKKFHSYCRELLEQYALSQRSRQPNKYAFSISTHELSGNGFPKEKIVELHKPELLADSSSPISKKVLMQYGRGHGALRLENIVVSQEEKRFWLLAVANSGEMYFLDDFASLEISILQQISLQEDIQENDYIHFLDSWITPAQFKQHISLNQLIKHIELLQYYLSLLQEVRRSASIINTSTILRDYYTCLFYHLVGYTLNTRRNPDGRFPNSAHRMAMAMAMIGDRLYKWNDWKPHFPTPVYIKDHKLYLPNRPEPIKLKPQIEKFLSLLIQRPNRIVDWGEVQETLWGGKKISYKALIERRSKLVTRTRKAIELDRSKPRHLIVKPRQGVEFRPYD